MRAATRKVSSGIPEIDLSRPNIARVFDYWLGGKDNFRLDRELAEKLAGVFPLAPVLARESRAFLGRAVSYVGAQGIGQFIDLGAGLPTSPAVHEGTGVAVGDVGDPEAILAAPELTGLIDLSQPCCVILAMVLHFFAPEQAARIARAFITALVPGSYLILSGGTGYDPGLRSRFASTYTAGTVHHHSPQQIAGYFGDLHLVDPGLTDARYWRDQPGPDTAGERPAVVLVGVGAKTA
jgi:hypothetical protein